MVYRSDNRTPEQMRPVKIIPDYITTAEGSALIEVGNTRVICTASVEESVPAFLRNTDYFNNRRQWRAGFDTSPYRWMSFSGHYRSRISDSDYNNSKMLLDPPSSDFAGYSAFIDCDVIQADGGTRTASITGAFVALGLAMQKMVEAGTLTSAPIRDYVAATSVGIVDGEVLLDLNYEEDSRAEVDMNLVMTGSKKIVEIQGTAEQHPFDDAQLKKMMDLARKGIESLVAKQQAMLGSLLLRQ